MGKAKCKTTVPELGALESRSLENVLTEEAPDTIRLMNGDDVSFVFGMEDTYK